MGELGTDLHDGGSKRDGREGEPSMEDILSSIKRIIAEDAEPAADKRERKPQRVSFAAVARAAGAGNVAPPSAAAAPAPAEDEDDVLELDQPMPEPRMKAQAQALPTPAAEETAQAVPEAAAQLVSSAAFTASRSKLDELSRLIVKPEITGTDTLEGMVRDMLRPMLSDWLDANLPRLVEQMVAREISRITGGNG